MAGVLRISINEVNMWSRFGSDLTKCLREKSLYFAKTNGSAPNSVEVYGDPQAAKYLAERQDQLDQSKSIAANNLSNAQMKINAAFAALQSTPVPATVPAAVHSAANPIAPAMAPAPVPGAASA